MHWWGHVSRAGAGGRGVGVAGWGTEEAGGSEEKRRFVCLMDTSGCQNTAGKQWDLRFQAREFQVGRQPRGW